MRMIVRLFALVGARGQWMLIAGLAAGLLWPQAAGGPRAHFTELVFGLLFFAALRVDPVRAAPTRATIIHDALLVVALQFVLPVAVAALVALAGWSGPRATYLVMIAAACATTGTPPVSQLLGFSGALALRLLVAGTLLLPLTSPLPLRLALGSGDLELLGPTLRLAAIILVSVGGAVLVRRKWLKTLDPEADQAIGGISAILLAFFILGLMDAVQPALFAAPVALLGDLLYTFALCFGLQAAGALVYGLVRPQADFREVGAVGVCAGSRNMALFLAALPADQMEPLMVLVGCFQIPMFLSPLLMRPVYRAVALRLPGRAQMRVTGR
ncbi:hypothetical protein [Propylenella binzhouense]|uniref:Bile acid:sodium symporter n=1 Tax=Propylenella binzhouense TaxID=2555902 RepID=A0A964T4H8_9HYPH|nr:hypothetical protein [Propylenella binzhouense]MYZ48356.1 hypothetical protein [Propylenella binzhouense]